MSSVQFSAFRGVQFSAFRGFQLSALRSVYFLAFRGVQIPALRAFSFLRSEMFSFKRSRAFSIQYSAFIASHSHTASFELFRVERMNRSRKFGFIMIFGYDSKFFQNTDTSTCILLLSLTDS